MFRSATCSTLTCSREAFDRPGSSQNGHHPFLIAFFEYCGQAITAKCMQPVLALLVDRGSFVAPAAGKQVYAMLKRLDITGLMTVLLQHVQDDAVFTKWLVSSIRWLILRCKRHGREPHRRIG